MKNLTQEQIDDVVKWMNTWAVLNDTAIPLRFREDYEKKIELAKEAVHVKPIQVILKLHTWQFLGMNAWRYTLNGEERIATIQYVEFHCMSLEDVVNSFKMAEVESFKIIGSNESDGR